MLNAIRVSKACLALALATLTTAACGNDEETVDDPAPGAPTDNSTPPVDDTPPRVTITRYNSLW